MSTKELVIEMHVPLSGDMFDDAAMITKVHGIFAAIRERADSELGEGGYTLSVKTPTTRAPRAPRADTGVPRGPRGKKGANGVSEQPPV